MTTRDHRFRPTFATLIAPIIALIACVPALAQRQGMEFVDQANQAVAKSGAIKAADTEWFPLIAAMDPPPRSLTSVEAASLLLPLTDGWDNASAWATGEAQQAALDKALEVLDYPERYRITLPYGTEGVDQAWIDAGLAAPMRDGLLATTSLDYLDKLDTVAMLLTLEATRLAEEGETDKALDILIAWYWMGRIVLEREFVEEKLWGAEQMHDALERVRDLVYTYDYNFEPEQMKDTNERIHENKVQIDRIKMPRADRLAARQLVARTMAERGGVLESYFMQTMGLLGAGDHPLQAFSEAAHWRDIARVHAGHYDTNQQIDNLYGDWEKRLSIENVHDPLLERLTDYDLMDKRRYRLADVTMAKLAAMMPLRLELTSDLRATRMCMGVMGHYMANSAYPRTLAAAAPHYVARQHFDPYNYNLGYNRYDPFEYFVPIRDQFVDPAKPRQPHEVTVQEADESDRAAAEAAAAAVSFDDFPYGAFDIDAGTVDSKRIRDYYQRKYDTMADTSLPTEEFAEMLEGFVGAGIRPADAARASELLGAFLIDAETRQALVRYGFDPNEISDNLARMVRDWISSEAFSNAYDAVKDGKGLDPQLVRDLLKSSNEASNQDKYLRPITQAVKRLTQNSEGLGATSDDILRYILQGSLSQFAFKKPEIVYRSFTIGVDDSTFILYSVGEDGAKNAARNVGAGGKDILYWPSILSLKRQYLTDVARGLAE